jgi:hypothetical protein
VFAGVDGDRRLVGIAFLDLDACKGGTDIVIGVRQADGAQYEEFASGT